VPADELAASPRPAYPDAPGEPHRSVRKVALTALAATSIEWYDFFLYGTAAALVFPTVFFPAEMPPLVGQLASFSTFAVGFIARPIGGVVFGHFGDRLGRKRALVTALLMMGVATTLIGCLPSYAAAGALAPVLLIVLRFVQGLAIGGQWAGAVLLATESAPPAQRGFYGSLAQTGAPIGTILANLAFLLASSFLSDDAFLAWGWRLPFLVSVVLIGLGLYVQLRLEDTAAFRELRALKEQRDADAAASRALTSGIGAEAARAQLDADRQPSPVLEALRAYPRQIALVAGAFVAAQVTFYILVAFVIAYGSGSSGIGIPRATMLTGVLIGAVLMIPGVILAAMLSDRYGRRGLIMLSAALLAVWGFAIFPLIDRGSLAWISLAIGVGQILVGGMYGPQAAFFAEIFETRVRYSGASLGYQLGGILGGGLAPIIATALLASTGGTTAISVYIALACLVSIVSVWWLKETYRNAM
jgi:MFS family permease